MRLSRTYADAEGEAYIADDVELLVDANGVSSELGILLRNPGKAFDLFIVKQGECKVWVGFEPDCGCLSWSAKDISQQDGDLLSSWSSWTSWSSKARAPKSAAAAR